MLSEQKVFLNHYMKNLKNCILLFVAFLALGSCYDDSGIKDDISDLQKRVSNLEALCTQINTNLVAIQTLVNSLNNNDYITSVTPIKNGDEILGYTITFLKNSPITIFNGENGKDGQNGTIPQIGVKQDIDGVWYWTIGGDWLLDNNGQKVRASGLKGDKGENGKDATAPQLKIVDGYWFISTDNGVSWTNIGKATGNDGKDGKDGDSMFKSVTYDDKYAYFTLVNGTLLTVPMNTNVPKLQFTLDKEEDIHLTGGESITLGYTISCLTGANTTLTSYENNNWKVEINKTSALKGTIKITAPNPVESGKIMLVLTDDYGNVFMKTLEIIGDDNIIKIIKTAYTIDEYGGYIDVAVDANISYTVQIATEGEAWISYQGKSGANDRFLISANADYNSRSSLVRFKGTDGETTKDITITQLQNNAIVLTSNTINVSEESQTYPLVVRANVDCNISIPSGVSWVSDITTKALVEKTFTLNIKENEDYAPRSVVITVSDTGNKIQQTITLTQSGYTPVFVTIPDANFLASLLEDYDINGDAKIDQKEALKVTSINCAGKSITSLSGIENFSNLTSLDCSKTKITSLDISSNNSLTNILCQNNELMTSVTLPAISSINARAFLGCTALTKLDIPNTVTEIGEDAFLNCSSMHSLTIHSNINTTYEKSFSGAAIHEVFLKDGASSIYNAMFANASVLERVTVGENVTKIGDGAFRNCLELYQVVFEKYSKLRTIERYAFDSCKKLTTLDMTNCQELSYVNVGGGSQIFTNHPNTPLLTISLGTRVPPTSNSSGSYKYIYLMAGTNYYFQMRLRVPSDCINAYKATSLWYNSSYVTIEALP